MTGEDEPRKYSVSVMGGDWTGKVGLVGGCLNDRHFLPRGSAVRGLFSYKSICLFFDIMCAK